MQRQSLYRQLARYYDLLYSFKDYRAEVRILRRLIARHKKSPGRDLLEVACGTGKHAQYLREDFRILATDANAGMLAVARRNVPGVKFQRANMLTLELGRQFDVILCLFSSIGYLKTSANLARAIRNFSRHLKTGGVLIIEPWFAKADYRPGRAHLTTYSDEKIKIARECVSAIRGNISVMDMHYLIAERNGRVRHWVDRHELAMFSEREFLDAMHAVGLRAKFSKKGLMKNRGLYLGVKK